MHQENTEQNARWRRGGLCNGVVVSMGRRDLMHIAAGEIKKMIQTKETIAENSNCRDKLVWGLGGVGGDWMSRTEEMRPSCLSSDAESRMSLFLTRRGRSRGRGVTCMSNSENAHSAG